MGNMDGIMGTRVKLCRVLLTLGLCWQNSQTYRLLEVGKRGFPRFGKQSKSLLKRLSLSSCHNTQGRGLNMYVRWGADKWTPNDVAVR
jgi:hypothetical protein